MTQRQTYSPSHGKGRRVSLVPLQLTTSPSKPSPSTEEPKKEKKEDIKAEVEKQDQRKEYAITKLDDTSCRTPKMDDTSKELEDKEFELSVDSSDQKMQAAKESDASIEDLDMVSKENEHQMDLIEVLLPDKTIGSSENKSILPNRSEEDPLVEVSHIDFIFGD